jgi:hypothetical protein
MLGTCDVPTPPPPTRPWTAKGCCAPTSRVAGRGPWSTLLTVTTPLLMPAILVFIRDSKVAAARNAATKARGQKTPTEALNQQLLSQQRAGVATTG